MMYKLYFINANNQKEHLISSKHKSVLINAVLYCATDEMEGDFYRFELVFNPHSWTYLLLDIMYKVTDVVAEFTPMDNVLEDLIDIMREEYRFQFILEEEFTDE